MLVSEAVMVAVLVCEAVELGDAVRLPVGITLAVPL